MLFSNSARYNQLILKQRNPQSQPTENFKHFGRTSSVGEIIFECTELCTGETERNTFVFRTRLSLLIIIISRTGFHLIHGTLIGDRKQLPIFCQSDRLISCKSECIPAL